MSAPTLAAVRSPAGRTAALDGRAGWVVTAAGSLASAVVLGVFGTIGVLIDPLARELGVPRTHLVPLFGVALLVHSIAASVAGRIADRTGPRPLMITAGVGTAAGLLVVALASDVRIVLAGYGLGLGVASASVWVATSTAASSWFRRRRAAAFGVLSASGGVGGMVLAPLAAGLAQSRGPRVTCMVLAAVAALLCAVGAALVRRHPDVRTLQPTPDGPTRLPVPVHRSDPGPAPTVLRRLYLAASMSSLVAFLPVVFLAGQAADVGLTVAEGAAVLSLLGAVSAAARIAIGLLGGRVRLLDLYRACHLLMMVAFLLWAFTGRTAALPLLIGFAVLFGLGYGGWLALGPALLAALCPARRLGRALGTLGTIGGLAGFAGPLLAAPLFTAARSLTLLLATGVLVMAALLLPRSASRPG